MTNIVILNTGTNDIAWQSEMADVHKVNQNPKYESICDMFHFELLPINK